MHKFSKKNLLDGTVIGAALVSMFFGAGNMIFPPYLGLKSGTEWIIAFLFYFIADIGLAIIAVMAQIKVGGGRQLLEPLGKRMGPIFMFVVMLCIGPIITIPRTAATTYELSITPLAPNFNMPLFYAIFFTVVLLLCIKKSAVVDIVGKILTPLLFIGLMILIIIGVINPLGEINIPPRTVSVVASSIEAGYQSMDVLAAIIFGVLIIGSLGDKGYRKKEDKFTVAAISSAVSGVALMIIYLGLTYLGASAAAHYNMHITRTELLISIIKTLIPGTAGIIFFAVIAGLACLSTAIALTGSAAEYVANITKNKIKYPTVVVLICVFDTVISCLGVEQLINIASPVLSIIYPPILVIVILSLIREKLNPWCFRAAGYTALLISVLSILPSFGLDMPFIRMLPLSRIGFAWLLPSAIAGIIGWVIGTVSQKKKT